MSNGDPSENKFQRQDPSALTTQQTLREIAMLREIIEARLDGMDKAIKLTAAYPTLLDTASTTLTKLIETSVARLGDLHSERFDSIAKQFLERDTRTAQAAEQSQKAIDAAFSAQKEAGAKTEALFTKLFDQMRETNAANTKASDDKFADVKERVGGIENRTKGGSAMWGYVAAGIGLLISLVFVGLALFKTGTP